MERNIPSGHIGRQFPGQQLAVRACHIDITVKINPEGWDDWVPLLHMLDLVKKEIYFSLRLLCPFHDVLIEVIRILQPFKTPGLEVDLYDIFLWNAPLQKDIPDLGEQDRLSTSSKADQHLDQILVNEWTYLIQIQISSYHLHTFHVLR